ncbi:uncharacterized protein [Antedon mediterranea]|uniref:uncharacterized protein n=1 Tax=Antedon mediterranea TaxID=105859 RepID=UPI003AF5F33C
MSGQKVFQFLDKKDLECAICLERFTEPKTLECLHSYCLHCLQSLIKTSGNVKCPKCCTQYDDISQQDLNNFTINEMLSNQVKNVEKIESGKPSECSSCDNQPEYYCPECQIYQCGQCIQQHKIISLLKDHSLYTLDKNNLPNKCKIHGGCMLEFFCRSCSKSGCKKCEHVLCCYQNSHNVIPFKTAVDEFNQNAKKVKKCAEEIKEKLKGTRDTITREKSDMESEFKLCRTAIESQEQNIIKKVQEKTRTLITDLEKIYKKNMEVVDERVKRMDSKLMKVNEMSPLINTMMNKPEERETLKSHETNVNVVKDEVLKPNFDESIFKGIVTPSFIPSKNLDNVINLEGIGKIGECLYEVAEGDRRITVIKGQTFEVKVSSAEGSETSLLAATLIDIDKSGKESATVKHLGSGVYKITGRCPKEGESKMKITARGKPVKGSPVNIKVNAQLVHTIDKKQLKVLNKEKKVKDVLLDKDGCILISSCSQDLLRFNAAYYSFVGRVLVNHRVNVAFLHQMGDGHIVHSDTYGKTVVMCDDKLKKIHAFGKGLLKNPCAMTVNKETRTMYVADSENHCVFKFNVDNGKLLGEIGTYGSEGQMNRPYGVTLTKEGNLIVADCGNNRIQMFDANDKFMRILVDSGKKDGHVVSPHYVAIDSDENILVSSNHKLQLFDKNGVFIKRIDDGGLDNPLGITIISNQPRRVAVANWGTNNVKIYNYMLGQKAFQFKLEKNDLECAICLERLTEPKTLECLHSYCLHCLQSLLETSGKIKCPKCCKMYDDLNQFDFKDLTTNEMLSYQLEYVKKIEKEKPSKCLSSDDNQPEYYCSECQLYLCGQCIKLHEIIPSTKNHSLYTLDKDDLPNKCKFHGTCMLEFYCRTCSKSGCKKCEYVLRCYQNEHNVILFKTAVDEFNQNVTDVMKSAKEIKEKLEETCNTITKERSDMESELTLSKTAIKLQEENIIKKVHENSRALLTDLEQIYKENREVVDDRVNRMDSKLMKVNRMSSLINTMMNKPEERDTFKSHEAKVNVVKDEVLKPNFDESIFKGIVTPSFIPSKNLDVINLEGIGKIGECLYEVAKGDRRITVIKGQTFEVKVSSAEGSETSLLAATLFNESGEESDNQVTHQGSGEYKITGRPNKEGKWKMNITCRAKEIEGSPVKIKVKAPVLVHTIDNIGQLKVHNNHKEVKDVLVQEDGCILISSYSKDLLKFNKEYSFIGRISLEHRVNVAYMHQMDDGKILHGDTFEKTVVMCDDKLKKICTFGEGTFKHPCGLTVNKETRIMYVADSENHCVFKFNVDNGKLLGQIGSYGSNGGYMNQPYGVALTKEGNIIVADRGNNRIQMFDANDEFMRNLVGAGCVVESPHYVIIDSKENILVSSNHKLQLFDKNGVFIKRIDDGGLNTPLGIAIISNQPRRVAVANFGSNNNHGREESVQIVLLQFDLTIKKSQ